MIWEGLDDDARRLVLDSLQGEDEEGEDGGRRLAEAAELFNPETQGGAPPRCPCARLAPVLQQSLALMLPSVTSRRLLQPSQRCEKPETGTLFLFPRLQQGALPGNRCLAEPSAEGQSLIRSCDRGAS